METTTYSSTGKLTYIKNMYDVEYFYEYDYTDNIIYIKRVSPSGKIQENWIDYNDRGQVIHSMESSGEENWYFYDDSGNKIYAEYSNGKTEVMVYDKNNRLIYNKDYNNIHHWYSCDESGEQKVITSEDFFVSPDKT